MATIKSYSDLQQSKKLAEMLPLESADMVYRILPGIKDNMPNQYIAVVPDRMSFASDIPCWSLASLLGALPYPYIEQNYKGKWICRVEHENTTYLWEDSNPIDACVAMIEKLHELKLL